MNMPYLLIILNGIDNISTALMLSKPGIYELNPIQRYFINIVGLFPAQVFEFLVFSIIIISVSYFFYKKCLKAYYIFNGILALCFFVTIVNNIYLIAIYNIIKG